MIQRLCWALAALFWLVGPAQAGGVKAGRLSHQICLTKTCTIDVEAAVPGAGTDCQVKVPDVVFASRRVESIEWRLKGTRHQFEARRVRFDDNDTSEGSTPSGQPNFIDRVLGAAPTSDIKDLTAAGNRRFKAFTYTLHLQWLDAAGKTAGTCTPHDPIIINGSD